MIPFNPIIVGGFPGSGTRIIVKILQDLKIFMGTKMNKSNDALSFVNFYNDWIDDYLNNQINDLEKPDMISEIKKCIEQHLAEYSNSYLGCGFKNPRSILLIPFLHSVFPQMKFIHIVRDGRDIAFSEKKLQNMKSHSKILLGKFFDSPEDRLQLWSKIINLHNHYCETILKSNYLLIKYESLCFNTQETITQLCNFLNIPNKNIEHKNYIDQHYRSIGRWKQNPNILYSISKNEQNTLRYFGYD